MVTEIVYVKHLAKHISTEDALIPIFVFRAKQRVVACFNFEHIAAPETGRTITAIVSPRASLQRN